MAIDRRGAATRAAGYGMGKAQTDAASMRISDPETLLRQVEARFQDPDYLPPVRPQVASVLTRLATLAGVDRGEVRALFELDPVLAGMLVRAAAGPRKRPIRSFKALWAGTDEAELHRIIVRAHRKARVLRNDAYGRALGEVARHSALTARAAALLARSTPIPSDHAWFCAILHDAGLAAGLAAFGDARRDEIPPLDQLLLVLDGIHDRVSWSLAKVWGLPPDVRTVLASHHNPIREGVAHPVAALICVADALAASLGAPAWTCEGLSQAADSSGAAKVAACREELGIAAPTWSRIGAQLREEWRATAAPGAR